MTKAFQIHENIRTVSTLDREKSILYNPAVQGIRCGG